MFRRFFLNLLQHSIQIFSREEFTSQDHGGDFSRIVNVDERICVEQYQIRDHAFLGRARFAFAQEKRRMVASWHRL